MKKPPVKRKATRKKRIEKLKGIPASPGIFIGKAYVIERFSMNIPQYWINNKEIPLEVRRFQDALEATRAELEGIQEKLCRFEGKEQINILEAYLLILQDEMVTKKTIEIIKKEHLNAEWALQKNLEVIQNTFEQLEENHLKERRYDFNYIGERILKHLEGRSDELLKHLPKGSVVVAHDLSPAETSQLNKYQVKALITEIGGATSHTAIISRALEIPAIVGCHNALKKIRTDQTIIADGTQGEILLKPTPSQIRVYENTQKHQDAFQKILLKDIHLPSETRDGFSLRLAANIELVDELSSIKEHGAEGIGLYRTEFLFLNRDHIPTEEEHFQSYKKVLSSIYPNYTTIRTVDIGGDKIPSNHPYEPEINPALGLRGIRLSLKEKQGFKNQLRAMLRASLYGKLKILFPLICDVEEFRKAKNIFHEVQEELQNEKIDFDPNVKVGVMIEVPSSVMLADELAHEADFFSIGTNDLTQYTLATDRANEHVAYLYRSLHPAILRMIKKSVDAAHREQIEISVCGEMAGDPLYLLVLVGLGLNELSMNALSIPRAKRMIRTIDFSSARALTEKTLLLKTATEMEQFVRKEVAALMGENFKEIALQSP